VTPAPLFDRVALWILVPSILLPAIALMVFPFGGYSERRPAPNSIAILVYTFVLLGSMTVNAWLRLRSPDVPFRRALTWRGSVYTYAVAVFAAILLVLIATWPPIPEPAVIVMGLIGAALSIASWADAVQLPPRTTVGVINGYLSGRAQTIITGAAAGTGAAIVLFVSGFTVFPQPVGQLLPLLIAVGLPWSHPVAFLTLPLSILPGGWGYVAIFAIAACGLVNVGLALAIARSHSFRLRAMRRFFRLRESVPVERGDEQLSVD